MATIASGDPARAGASHANESVRAEIGHLAAMDGLRGVALLWVLLFHILVLRRGLDDPWMAAMTSSRPVEAFFGAGFLGVDLFFLISGFLLTLPWFLHARKELPPPSARQFYVRRFWRIAPAYYVQLALLFLVVLPLLRGSGYWRTDLYVYLFNAPMHALFLHNTTPLTSGSMAANGALWTLAVEAQYYVLVPLLAPLFLRAPRFMLAASFIAAAWWRIGTYEGLGPIVAMEMSIGERWHWPESVVRLLLLHQLPSYLGHFALGILLGRVWLRWREREPSVLARRALVAVFAFAMGALFWSVSIDGLLLGRHTWVIHVLGLAALLFWAVASGSRASAAILGHGPLAFIGRISYSGYLYHLPLLLLFNKFAGSGAWVLPAYLVTLVAIAWLSWRYVEQPFLKGVRLLWRP